jgi:hypothetical protein
MPFHLAGDTDHHDPQAGGELIVAHQISFSHGVAY